MPNTQDASVGIGVESTYATPVTPTRWYEFTEEGLEFKPMRKQGKGLRVGGRLARSARRVTTSIETEGSLEFEAVTRGMGLLLKACMGAGASTLVSGSTYQQNFTLGDVQDALTIQKGVPREDGTIDAYTFGGMVVSKLEISAQQDEIVTIKVDFDGSGQFSRATGYTAPSYTASANLYTFTHGALTTGTFTAPTTTALASAATPVANVTEFSLEVDQKLTGGQRTFGSSGRRATIPRPGNRADNGVTGKLKAIYTNTTFRDASHDDTDLSLVLTFTSAEALSTGFATMQIAIPVARLEPTTPMATDGEVVEVDYDFTVLDGGVAAQPLWIICRTADAAL
jgi:hypothetical protein